MATSKKLYISVNTNLGKTKNFIFNSPKNGLTRANAETFANLLSDENVLNPTDPGDSMNLVKAYYEETITTDLA